MTEPLVVALVVSYNGRRDLLECLESVFANTYAHLQVLVVDNGGSDGSGDAVRSRYPDAEVVRVERNEGLVHGIDVGMTAALARGCDHVLYLNDDVILAPECVAELVRAAQADPRAATVTGPIFYHASPERLWYAGGGILWPVGKTYHRGRGRAWRSDDARPRRIAYAAGTVTLVRADAVRDVGLWDEDYFLVFEDADWCVRATRQGWRHLYAPAARSWHKVSVSYGGEKAPLYLYFLFRNNIRFMCKLARPWHWPGFVVFFAIESVLRYSLAALGRPDRWRRLRAIALAIGDATRGRYGRGSSDRIAARRE